MINVKFIKETYSIKEANDLLQKNWVLLEVCNTRKGLLYVLGELKRKKIRAYIPSESSAAKNQLDGFPKTYPTDKSFGRLSSSQNVKVEISIQS